MKPWFTKDHFLPRNIEKDPYWQKLSDNGKKFYRFICEHSWLTKKSPHRRYARHTDKQIAEHIGVSDRQVRRYKKYCLDNNLLILVTPGNSGTTSKTGRPTAPVFEIPASAGMIYWWGRTRGARKKALKAKEVKHGKTKRVAPRGKAPLGGDRKKLQPRNRRRLAPGAG